MNKVVLFALGILVLLGLAVYFGVNADKIEVPPEFKPYYEDCLNASGNMGAAIKAIQYGDPSFCSGLAEPSTCIALATSDESLCENSSCRAIVRGNFVDCEDDIFCQAFVSHNQDLCDAYAAHNVEEIGQCKAFARRDADYFTSKEAMRHCADVTLFTTDHCDSISDGSLRQLCFLQDEPLSE